MKNLRTPEYNEWFACRLQEAWEVVDDTYKGNGNNDSLFNTAINVITCAAKQKN
jgi:hypothetical protein